jgi:hypothetical protein
MAKDEKKDAPQVDSKPAPLSGQALLDSLDIPTGAKASVTMHGFVQIDY